MPPKSNFLRYRRALQIGLLGLVCTFNTVDARASARSLSPKDLQIFAKAVGFIEPAPTGTGVIAIVYAQGDAASKQDADEIAANFNGGLKAGRIGGISNASNGTRAAAGEVLRNAVGQFLTKVRA